MEPCPSLEKISVFLGIVVESRADKGNTWTPLGWSSGDVDHTMCFDTETLMYEPKCGGGGINALLYWRFGVALERVQRGVPLYVLHAVMLSRVVFPRQIAEYDQKPPLAFLCRGLLQGCVLCNTAIIYTLRICTRFLAPLQG